MLKKFIVENFKGFEKPLIFDLSAREYSFNSELVQNSIVNKAIVYGKNGIGKSSLGIAIFDIVSHLTDKEKMNLSYVQNYRNLNNPKKPVKFTYIFQFGNDTVEYTYHKLDPNNLVDEILIFNGKTVINYNYNLNEDKFIDPSILGNLNVDLVDNKLSVLKYIYRNTPSNFTPLLTKMISFCENMLWYRGLSEGNTYSGFTNGSSSLVEKLYESGKVKEFETFLRENGMNYSLEFNSINGTHELFAYYNENKSRSLFVTLASTGTMALFLFFIWKITSFNNISFLFIDEFDAFLHYESSINIIETLNQERNFQTVLTTHNTSLIDNKISRPDCFYIMTENKITSFANATSRELREGHNLEKLYKSGEFDGQE